MIKNPIDELFSEIDHLSDTNMINPNLTFIEALNNWGLGLHELSGVNLDRESLREAELQNANFQGASLEEVNFIRANLRHADLRNTNLRFTDLREANLSNAKLEGADLTGANLQYCNLNEANLREADFENSDLSGANLWGAKVGEANFEGALLDIVFAKAMKLDYFPTDVNGIVRIGFFPQGGRAFTTQV